MNDLDPAMLTNSQLKNALAGERPQLVEAYLLASIRALRPEVADTADAASHLADLAIDSLQIVELKFALDEVLGQEVDVELIINNPTVGNLAASSVQAAGL